MVINGKAWTFGHNVDTDIIIPAKYLNTSDPDELAAHCMEPADPEFPRKITPGDLIVAGRNFGCGSSREHAPVAIKFSGVGAVIADSFARIFYRNAFNMGLPILESPDASADIRAGDRIEADLASGSIINHTQGKTYQAQPIPPFMRALLDKGGLVAYVREQQNHR